MFPWQKDDASPKFALLLTRLEDEINIDRAALRQAGLTRLHSVSLGEKALEIIGGQSGENPALAVDFVICTGDLEDMSLSAFLRALAALKSALPVMVISGSDSELALAISQGAAAGLRRPYSMNELARAIEGARAQNPGRAARPRLLPAPDKSARARISPGASSPALPPAAKARKDEAVEPAAPKNLTDNKLLWTRTGLSLLRQGKTSSARQFLLGAIEYDPLDLEAAVGLSRLYQQLGDAEKSHRWQHRAGYICLTAKQADRAEVIFSRLPEKWQGDHELIEAQELLLDGNFDAACEAFIHICSTRSLALHKLLGRACQFTSAPEDSMRELCAALVRAGYESTARSLAARMLSGEEEREWEPGGFLARFPRLQEVWAVARFTAQALKDKDN